jgi:hypothetical protein
MLAKAADRFWRLRIDERVGFGGAESLCNTEEISLS